MAHPRNTFGAPDQPDPRRPLGRRRWPRVVVGLLALLLMAMALLAWALGQADLGPIYLTIDGIEHLHGLDLTGMPYDLMAALLFVAACAALVALLVVPTLLLAVTLVVGLALLTGVGLPVMAVLLAVALLLAPVAGLGFALWWLARRLFTRRNAGVNKSDGRTTIGA